MHTTMQILWAGSGRHSPPAAEVWCYIGEESEKPGTTLNQNGRVTDSGDSKLISGSGSV